MLARRGGVMTTVQPPAVNPGECPRCHEHSMMTPPGVNALSRLAREPDDESIWICSDCGTDEALEQHLCIRVTPRRYWPLPNRTFQSVIDMGRLLTSIDLIHNQKEG